VSHGALQFMAYEELKKLCNTYQNESLNKRLVSLFQCHLQAILLIINLRKLSSFLPNSMLYYKSVLSIILVMSTNGSFSVTNTTTCH